jgi:tRNA-dihydrouridine synthase
MILSLAPMRSLTDYIFRNNYYKYFDNLDRYYTPFIDCDNYRKRENHYTFREVDSKNIITPELKEKTIPQLMMRDSSNLAPIVNIISEYGYKELNLNFGCPFPQSVKRGRGSALLLDKNSEQLNSIIEFMENQTKIDNYSIKIRTGAMKHLDNLENLNFLKDCKKLNEIIVHPRTVKSLFKGRAKIDYYIETVKHIMSLNDKLKIIYNGDLCTLGGLDVLNSISNEISTTPNYMIGRGVLKDLDLASKLKGSDPKISKDYLREFMNAIYEDTNEIIKAEKDLLFKLKEKWFYFSHMFTKPDKVYKIVKKSKSRDEYLSGIDKIFDEFYKQVK